MELHYFLTTNGSAGHFDFVPNLTETESGFQMLYGYPRELCASLIRECYAIAKQKKTEVHIVHNALDNSMEGIFLPSLATGLLNRPVYENRPDVSALFKSEALPLYHRHMEQAFSHFLTAKKIHDDWEKIYIGATDYKALNTYCEELIHRLLDGHKTQGKGKAFDRFFGAATTGGALDYVENLSLGLTRYFIKGRPGTGKSTFLKKLAVAAMEKGFDVERYHCAFDPNSLDMVVVRTLGFCVFDATAPHKYEPSTPKDTVFDFYAAAVQPETDTRFETELSELARRYKESMSSAVSHLVGANNACLAAEKELFPLIDNDRLMQMRKTLLERLFA